MRARGREREWGRERDRKKKLMKQLLIRSYLEFSQQYWLHCRWDKISLEGTGDLHRKDKTVAQQKPQHSDPAALQGTESAAEAPQLKGHHACTQACACARQGASTSLYTLSFIFTAHRPCRRNAVGERPHTPITISSCVTRNQYWSRPAIS